MLVDDVKRIAVLRANALGDYVFALPALESLRAAYPDAEIVLLGAEWHVRDLSGRPGPVDRFVLASGPVEEKFDLAVQLHGGGAQSNPLVAGLGARVTAGLRAEGAPALDRTVPYIYYQSEVFRHLEVVGLVGAPPVTYRPRWALTDRDVAEAARVVPDAPFAVLHPGANDPRRRWPPDRFAAVGDALRAAGVQVFVSGTGTEAPLADAVVSAMRAPATSLAGTLSLGGLAALLARSAVVVANDTGPLHLAAAVGAPVVGLYWVGNFINSAFVDRSTYRPLISWTNVCPECGAPANTDEYPRRGGMPTCGHRPSFLIDIPVSEAVGDALDLVRR
ncbi:LPS biosynthesis-related glycosyltransferase [Virgisporangium aliadipatigenens]|uniref:LPS biosynthesis-related glycosyltransferase n=1 Tax=Virgisporangium aliadipatigenens TaxID=741659 RepID=A0A8J3YRV2_9ACTN|nr:glycosyltransferase family 9 protein [Virgisporangium aliadipatigenens]GIJ48725.1 LPS biosynthesis-related glycosyltransferase [Virgisporangium aliadipatigenens]